MTLPLQVEGLEKTYRSGFPEKAHSILKGVSFEIQPGRITGFLGRNGAGKTTTLKCVLGLVKSDKGRLSYFGQEGLTSSVKERIGFLPERPYFYDHLTGEEFLTFYAELSGRLSKVDLGMRIDQVLALVDMERAKKKRLREFSKGMLQRIGIAQALIHRPELLILDEPMSGLDPDGRMRVIDIIRETAKQGTTVFFSSHLLNDAEVICNDLVIVDQGKTIFTGPLDNLLDRLGHGYKVVTEKSGVQAILKVGTKKDLQDCIDRCRKQGDEIIEVRREKPSLEEAFIQISEKK